MSILNEERIQGEIENLLKEQSPLSARQIAEKLLINEKYCIRCLKILIESGKVVQLQANSSGRTYYIANKRATVADVDNMHIEIAKDTVEAKDTYEDLSEKIKKIDDNVNGIYANIISIMSIFVAIFALIVVNTNIAFELAKENMSGVFFGIIAINIFVVICIVALLLSVKLIIINPLLGKRRGNKKDD